jgi:hypothetical protein
MLYYNNIYLFNSAITAIITSILVNIFVSLIIKVKKVINIKLKAIASIAIIIIIFTCFLPSLFGLICFFYFAKGVLTSFTL